MSRLNTSLNLINSWSEVLTLHRAIAVIRSPNQEMGLAMAQAVANGGIRLVEITWNSDQPEKLIAELRVRLPYCYIGVGTILNPEQLQDAIASGAQFVFCPHYNPAIVAAAVEHYQVPIVPGALSPTEIINAWQGGASAVKVFPIETVGGANYIKCLQAPLGHIPLIPTGGVKMDNAKEMLSAGALAVGLSSSLFPKSLLVTRNWREITHRAQILCSELFNFP
ncbi:2-keto-3-deoxy-phosphogluconate aldolase [Stanieria cyanosphaera PCC 7437]|uniref:2-keto-3-deoxy-phosphogluconate aldolase n=1 Tax=Stanieria cyanosphaera (strain ATCC 29371 / PCC 7437) TaxID=111780 RepID=K9XPU5_STAC7|nr:bifunctional 4-hydroxy-2-oxoglutarate aldolase/2-dehydro-3-deoxy-phosphogluconate aldolase [Stanieria cyanosphaera]AFZ34640.1 2-keto-3-deoxy-phosphogluconate aldolase [Stanieria cyanosphaera PCC 7437]